MNNKLYEQKLQEQNIYTMDFMDSLDDKNIDEIVDTLQDKMREYAETILQYKNDMMHQKLYEIRKDVNANNSKKKTINNV